MDLSTFNKNIEVVKTWRVKAGKLDSDWPDSRDPEFAEIMAEAGTVPQDLAKTLVALCAWREGRQDVYQGMSAVVHVIRNRENLGMFRSHLAFDPQFDSMTRDYDTRLKDYPASEPGQDFLKILENLDDILQGKTVDLSQGGIYYGEISDETPEWFQQIVSSPEYERTVKIGNRTFYKRKK